MLPHHGPCLLDGHQTRALIKSKPQYFSPESLISGLKRKVEPARRPFQRIKMVTPQSNQFRPPQKPYPRNATPQGMCVGAAIEDTESP